MWNISNERDLLVREGPAWPHKQTEQHIVICSFEKLAHKRTEQLYHYFWHENARST